MSEPAIAFSDLLAYTDYLAGRWLNYFRQHPKALEVEVGGRTPALRDLVTHIFQVEDFFSKLLLLEDMTATGRPAPMDVKNFEDLERIHREAHQNLTQYIGSTNEEKLEKTRTLGPVTVSNRKIFAQAVLHSVHHWAQVAMEVRQAGFPPEKPQDIIASPVMK
jgi:uncharacterized damage-inducible protein DinB